jgi:signal transduction histidine kinase
VLSSLEEKEVLVIEDSPAVGILLKEFLAKLGLKKIHYCQNGKTGTIKVYSEETDDEVRVMVSDNGIGIPYEKQANLFTKFYQVDASLTREKGGSGLGLSICKGIVEAHGGKISLRSSAEGGTTVTFSLPKHDTMPT